jgi:hypothetical protein
MASRSTGGAAEAQHVGPRGAVASLIACLDGNRARGMPFSRGRASAHAHPDGSPARSALIVFGSQRVLPIPTARQRSMPSSQFSRPSLPLFRYRDLGMLARCCCAVAHAHPEVAPARHALVSVVALSVMLTQSGRWRGWLFQVPRAFSFPPRWPNQALQRTPLAATRSGRF